MAGKIVYLPVANLIWSQLCYRFAKNGKLKGCLMWEQVMARCYLYGFSKDERYLLWNQMRMVFISRSP